MRFVGKSDPLGFTAFYKKVVNKTVVLSCSKSSECSILDFSDLKNFISAYVFNI